MPEQPSYVAYYGMNSDPFSDVAEWPFVPVAGRQKAVDTLLHLLNYSDDVVFIAGPPGSGKTTILEQMIRQLGENIDLVMVDVADISSDKELLWDLASQFSLHPDRSHSTERLQLMLQAHCQALHEQGQIPTLAIDDIDELPIETLGGLSPVLHGGINGEPGLRVVGLASQPAEVRRELSALGFASGQMIELPPLSIDDCVNLVQAYFATAGLTAGVPLEQATMKRLYKLSGGRPGPFIDGVRDFMLVEAQRRRRQGLIPWPHLVAGAAVISVIALAALYQTGGDEPSEVVLEPTPVPEAASPEPEDLTAEAPDIDPDVAEESVEDVRARLEEAISERADEGAGDVATPPTDDPVDSGDQGASIPDDLLADLHESPPPAPEPETPEPAADAPAPESADSGHPLAAPSWIGSADSTSYSLQLLGARDESNVQEFAEANNLEPDNAGYVRTELDGDPWYVLLYGIYEDSDAAREAITDLPDPLQATSPWPRPLSGLQ